jgi:hypothetical protein
VMSTRWHSRVMTESAPPHTPSSFLGLPPLRCCLQRSRIATSKLRGPGELWRPVPHLDSETEVRGVRHLCMLYIPLSQDGLEGWIPYYVAPSVRMDTLVTSLTAWRFASRQQRQVDISCPLDGPTQPGVLFCFFCQDKLLTYKSFCFPLWKTHAGIPAAPSLVTSSLS